MSVIFAIIPNFSASVWSLTTVYGLFRRGGAEISPSSACCHLSLSLSLHRSAVHGSESVLHALSTQPRPTERKNIFAGWVTGWSSLDLVSAGSVCKSHTRQSLSRQGAPRPVCFRTVTCDSVIYREKGGLEAWLHPLDGYKIWLWMWLSREGRSQCLLKCVNVCDRKRQKQNFLSFLV